MQLLKSLSASALSCVLLAACAAPAAKTQEQRSGADEQRKSAIRLNYHLYNRESVGLVRAFDDGQKTILQFTELDDIVVEVVDDEGKPVKGVRRIGMYLVTPALHRSLFVRANGKEAAVVCDAPDSPEFVLGVVNKDQVRAVPVAQSVSPKEEVVAMTTATAGKLAATPVQVASPAPSVAASPAAVVTQPVPAPAAPLPTWSITVADKSVRGLLERWSKTSGYQLLWEVPVDLELNANATLTGSYEDALNSVLASLANSAYPVEAMIYDNRAVRVVKRIPKEQQ